MKKVWNKSKWIEWAMWTEWMSLENINVWNIVLKWKLGLIAERNVMIALQDYYFDFLQYFLDLWSTFCALTSQSSIRWNDDSFVFVISKNWDTF